MVAGIAVLYCGLVVKLLEVMLVHDILALTPCLSIVKNPLRTSRFVGILKLDSADIRAISSRIWSIRTPVSMSTAVEAPQQHKQPSRKGKKAWRKNVDISEVQQGLEIVQEEVIKG